MSDEGCSPLPEPEPTPESRKIEQRAHIIGASPVLLNAWFFEQVSHAVHCLHEDTGESLQEAEAFLELCHGAHALFVMVERVIGERTNDRQQD